MNIKNKFLAFLAFAGGACLGFSFPLGKNLLPFRDYYLFLPLSILLLSVSYYKLIKKND